LLYTNSGVKDGYAENAVTVSAITIITRNTILFVAKYARPWLLARKTWSQ